MKKAIIFMHPLSTKPDDFKGGLRIDWNPRRTFSNSYIFRDVEKLRKIHPLYEERIRSAIAEKREERKIVFADPSTPDFRQEDVTVLRTHDRNPTPLISMARFAIGLWQEGIDEIILAGERYILQGKNKYGCLGAFEMKLRSPFYYWVNATVDTD